ncbi:MAG: hypothetical protein RL059_1375, partial [Bacteroidota bacterium]
LMSKIAFFFEIFSRKILVCLSLYYNLGYDACFFFSGPREILQFRVSGPWPCKFYRVTRLRSHTKGQCVATWPFLPPLPKRLFTLNCYSLLVQICHPLLSFTDLLLLIFLALRMLSELKLS